MDFKFPEEDARLCFGGYFQMRLQAISDLASQLNFQEINKSLYLFDCMLSGTNMNEAGVLLPKEI